MDWTFESRLTLHVCHFPPGTSKWNQIEHRLFYRITTNGRGKLLTSLETVVSLIGSSTTQAGLEVYAQIDDNLYPQAFRSPMNSSVPSRFNGVDFMGNETIASRQNNFISDSSYFCKDP
ncbi:MAG: hypothetical protein HC934_12695 [Acaryochloridaceae cyanobacterium SU_2_1]|nr:hypothetical protein [Acaryochloridaceae cyanobacterium SU_2_1]